MQLEKRGEGEREHVRLGWSFKHQARTNWKDAEIPCSDLTGPFSHFIIYADGTMLGKAYALEHILKKRFVEKNAGTTVDFELVGVGFDGQTLAKSSAKLLVSF
jgi:hypothetical protein